MKGFLIGPDNERFEADIIRYFKNVNDHYLIYTKGEKDANGYILLYATKVVSDSGIKNGENITDENEWALIKSFLQKTVSENKEGRPVTIEDCNPVEVNDLKINAQRPFKLSETSVDLFGQNKKSFEIVQKLAEEQNTVKVPVAPEIPEFVTPEVNNTPETTSDSDFNFEEPAPSPAEPEVTAENVEASNPTEETQLEPVAVSEPAESQVEEATPTLTESEVTTENTEIPNNTEEVLESTNQMTENYEELYKNEVEKNEALSKEIEQLLKDNAEYKEKIDKLKELLG